MVVLIINPTLRCLSLPKHGAISCPFMGLTRNVRYIHIDIHIDMHRYKFELFPRSCYLCMGFEVTIQRAADLEFYI